MNTCMSARGYCSAAPIEIFKSASFGDQVACFGGFYRCHVLNDFHTGGFTFKGKALATKFIFQKYSQLLDIFTRLVLKTAEELFVLSVFLVRGTFMVWWSSTVSFFNPTRLGLTWVIDTQPCLIADQLKTSLPKKVLQHHTTVTVLEMVHTSIRSMKPKWKKLDVKTEVCYLLSYLITLLLIVPNWKFCLLPTPA